jgi:drug/metabolite transporter (DMT)-like permease
MEQMTLDTLLAVFEEMFGFWLFWGLVVLAVLVTLAFLYVLVRDRGLESRRLVRAELAAPLGAIAAILFVQWITNSGFRDIGGPIDWVVLLGIGLAGAGGAMILVYVAQALAGGRRGES